MRVEKTPAAVSRSQHRSLILVNPPVVGTEGTSRAARSFLDLMVEGKSPDNNYSIPVEHLGLMSIKSYASEKGLSVDVVNGIVDEHLNAGETLNAICKVAKEHGPPALVGFSQILAFEQNLWLARQCKTKWPNSVTVFGQDFATLNWQRILREFPEVDFVCVGEGEAVFESLSRCLLEDVSIRAIPGLAYRSADGTPLLTPPRLLDLDALPWPARDELHKVKALGFAPAVFASRGCPYHCAYCTTGQATNATGKGSYRMKSAEHLAAEMFHLWKVHGCDFINICDDLFVTSGRSSRARAELFAHHLIAGGYRGRFMIDARVDSIDRDLFALLRDAGLTRVFVGVETGSETLLSSFDKRYGLRKDTIEQRLAELVDIGLEVKPGIISFHPTVRPDELRATWRIMESVNLRNLGMYTSSIMVFPGTTLHERYRRDGHLTEEWPNAAWKFANPRAERAYREIVATVQASANEQNLAGLSRRLDRILDEWEADEATASPDPSSAP